MSKIYRSICCYCGVGCGVEITKDAHNQLMITGDANYPVNQGMLCSKGMNLHYTVNNTYDRLLYPEMRYSRQQVRARVTWEQALDRTVSVFKTFIDKYGPDSVAFYASGQCLTEEYYVLNKLMKGFIGSNNIDTNSRLCMSSAVAAYKMSLGEDCVPTCYDDIEVADCIFVAGANPAWCHPILWRRVEAARTNNPNLKIIVSDPRVTQSVAIADVHLQLNPGTDIVLHHAIGRCLIEQGWINPSFIDAHTDGFEQYKDCAYARSLDEAARLCGVARQDIEDAARYIGQAKAFMSMWTMGLNQSVVGVNKNLSLINLHLITGQIGRPGAGPFSLTGQPNAMGGREVGGLSNLLPAHRNLMDDDDRKFVENFWGGTKISPQSGLTATEMFEALVDGRLKAIWIMCTNPLVSLPNVRLAEAALKNAKFVVVQEISNTAETLQYADVVLPAAAWAEKEGTMTNAERRVSYLEKIIEPPGEARADVEIMCDFAQRMGYHGFDYGNNAEIFTEHCALSVGTNIDMGGLSYGVLQCERSVQWPYRKVECGQPQSSPRLFVDQQFFTANRRARIHSVDDGNVSEKVSPDYPLILTTGRLRDHWHTMSKTGKVNKLKTHISQALLSIHPADAQLRNISDGQIVTVKSVRGEVRVPAQLTTDVKPGLVFLPMHWGKILGSDLNRANNLTHHLLDPISKEPDFKFSAVQVSTYQQPKRRIIVIGGGAGACAFVRAHRQMNTLDTITVFNKENQPFYNRVMLPDYINGTQDWVQLVKMTSEEECTLQFTLHRGVSIEYIDKNNKTVIDSMGREHEYDVLIVATGSRAAQLKNIPKMMSGIFTMRNRTDADDFCQYIEQGKGAIVVIGGGLLGIEMAASLREKQHDVLIINRTSRLMDRQLDSLASSILLEELKLKGINVVLNDEVERFLGDQRLSGIRLKSGGTLACQAVIMAIGTRPNVELLKNSDVLVKRGVLVNDYLQTSDNNIYAVGEIAEYKGQLYGISAAAEQQAEVVARYLNGDIASPYTGTLLMNILKMHGTDLVSMGLSEAPDNVHYEEVVFIDKAKRYYKKCIIHQDRLVGAILIGDKAEYLEFRDLIQNRTELSDRRLKLLRSGKTPEAVLGKLVCSCGNVGKGNIERAVRSGCFSVQSICEQTGAGMGCGSCRPEVAAIFEGVSATLEVHAL